MNKDIFYICTWLILHFLSFSPLTMISYKLPLTPVAPLSLLQGFKIWPPMKIIYNLTPFSESRVCVQKPQYTPISHRVKCLFKWIAWNVSCHEPSLKCTPLLWPTPITDVCIFPPLFSASPQKHWFFTAFNIWWYWSVCCWKLLSNIFF